MENKKGARPRDKKPPILLEKRSDGSYIPTTPADAERLNGVRVGEGIKVVSTKVRNYEFLKQWMKLVRYAYDQWEPAHELPAKNFTSFRKQITMLAGYSHAVAGLNGHIHMEADSLAFDDMDAETFATLYNATVEVLMKWVLTNYTKDDIKRVMIHISEFGY